MSWSIGNIKNLFLKSKSKLGLYHVVLTTPKTSPEKLPLTVVEMQHMPDIEKIDSKKEISCLKWTIYNGRRKVCVNFQTDTDELNIVVYRYRNNLYLKDIELDLKLSEYQSLLENEFISWATLTYSTSGALYWMKQLFIIETNSVNIGCSLSNEHFPIVPGIEIVIWTQ